MPFSGLLEALHSIIHYAGQFTVGSIALASQIETLLDIHIYCALPVSTELHHLLGWNRARLFSC
jgi:hypothetical protein